ncbi:hypothetical protein CR513_53600, partial [Mucuna pruriens]
HKTTVKTIIINRQINIRPPSSACLACLPTLGSPLAYATPQAPSKGSFIEVFMDAFMVYDHSFDASLEDKFRSYLHGSKIVVFSDHVALKFLLKKPNAKLRLIRWMLLLQEFDIEIRDKSGVEDIIASVYQTMRFVGGHFGSHQTARKDAHHIVTTYEQCQRAGVAINRRHEMLQQPILFCKVFDVWDGWRLRPPKLMMLKFNVPKALISDQGSHLYNKTMSTLLEKYGVVHKVATAYHPQTNGQAEVFNREIKQILPKVAHPNKKDWSRACHLPIEIEHRAYWVVKRCNLAFDQAGKERKLQLQEFEELRLEAYENFKIYKEKVKRFHDIMILRKEFKVGQRVLLFNSRLKLIAEYRLYLDLRRPGLGLEQRHWIRMELNLTRTRLIKTDCDSKPTPSPTTTAEHSSHAVGGLT